MTLFRTLPLTILVALSGFVFPRGLRAEDAETAARRGTRFYEEGQYAEAAEAFRRARELARREGDPPPAFDYNLGTTYARQGEFDRAVETLKEAAAAPEPEATPTVRERAFYNLGVSAARKGEALRGQGESQLNAEYETLQQALDAFRQSLILEPSDENARHNYALTKRRIDEIEKMMQEQQQQQNQQGQGEPSDQPQSDGEQEQQDPQSGEGPSGESENPESAETSSESDESPETQEQPSPSESAEEDGSGQEQRASPENGEDRPRESEDAAESRDREGEPPASSEAEQRGGLEATPTPAPERSPGDGEPQRSEGKRERPENSRDRPGDPGGATSAEELTPEQLDALRVLNSLEEGEPEQFRKLFRFRGGGEGRDLERDW